MAEGPQVRRRTEWLEKHLAGRKVLRCHSTREDIIAESFTGKRVEQVFCKGKHIFLEFEGGLFLHNHLLMRGTWKRLEGQQLFLPPNAWIAFYVGPYTICNLGGQMLKVVTKDQVDGQLASLGPDVMADPFPQKEISERLISQRLSVAEALLDQSVLAGVGNIAKSEILFSAGIDPKAKASELGDGEMPRLLNAIHQTLWASYKNGGRWKCSVYRKAGEACFKCGGRIRSIKQPPSRRTTYFCPKCQK
ncbi:DNA-formamidopyrimidine glycosylase family protein [Planctomycetota bacterium]